MEMIIVVLVVAAAAVYAGRNFYKQFTGSGNCASGCSCNIQNKQMCESDHSHLNEINFK